MIRDTCGQNSAAISCQVSPTSLLGVYAETTVENSGGGIGNY